MPLKDAVFNIAHAAMLVLGLATNDWELITAGLEDRLHQGYRRPAYPESADLVDALRARGVPATISGAGPTVLALTADGLLPDGIDTAGFTVLPLAVDTAGVVAETG